MSHASRQADAVARTRSERLQRWSAAGATALLHLALLLVALSAPPVSVDPPQGSSGGGDSLQVTWIDEKLPSPAPSPAPPPRPAAATPPRKAAPAPPRLQPPPVTQGEETVLPVPPAPLPDAEAPTQAQVPVEPPTPPTQRPAHMRGLPPGMRLEDIARASPGPGRSAVNRGRGNAVNASGTSLDVDGYQVLYEPLGEARMREWRDQGMTEVFLPLPGTRRYMVCPLEIVLRRGSGACRMVEPDSPELASIGDARQILLMQRVYRLGDELWSGPGPYR